VGQLIVAWDLLRLLLTHHFSLISYPCAFFTQVPLCPENGITFEDIGRIFGPPVLGWPVPAASHDDLVPQALEPHIGRPPQCRARRRNRTAFITILPPTSRHDMLVLKRADPFRSRGTPRIPLESDREDDCASRSGQLSPDGSLSHPSPGCFSGGTRVTSHLYSNTSCTSSMQARRRRLLSIWRSWTALGVVRSAKVCGCGCPLCCLGY